MAIVGTCKLTSVDHSFRGNPSRNRFTCESSFWDIEKTNPYCTILDQDCPVFLRLLRYDPQNPNSEPSDPTFERTYTHYALDSRRRLQASLR